MTARILVTDAHQVGGLSAIRALGSAGYLVTACAPSPWKQSGGCCSKYVSAVLAAPSPWANLSANADWLVETIRREQYDAVLPVSEASVLALNLARDGLSDTQTKLLLPPEERLLKAVDYLSCIEALRGRGVSTPRADVLCSGNNINTKKLTASIAATRLHRPLTITPSGRVLSARDFAPQHPEQVGALADECASQGASLYAVYHPQGRAITAFTAYWHGSELATFTQRELRVVDDGSPWSSYRKFQPTPTAQALAQAVLDEMQLDGLALVRVLLRENNEAIFHSLVPGCPVSMTLPTARGANLPALLADAALGRSEARPARKSRRPTRCVNFYPGEVRYLQRNVLQQDLSFLNAARSAAAVLADQVRPGTAHDYFSTTDPRPATVHFLTMARAASDALLRMISTFGGRSPDHTQWLVSRALTRPVSSVLFVCRGNTCRSFFAAERMRHYLDKARVDGILIRSAGVDTSGGGRPPERFRRLFARYSVPIDEHRSTPLTQLKLDEFDLIVMMDLDNAHAIRNAHPLVRARTILLGAVGPDKLLEVADPINDPPLVAARTFDRVDKLVAELATLVQARQPTPVTKGPSV